MPKHRILFKGYYNVHNFGDDLLFLALLEFFKNQMGWDRNDLKLYIEPEEKSLRKLRYSHPYKLLPYLDPLKARHARLKHLQYPSFFAKALMGLDMLHALFGALVYRATQVKMMRHRKNIHFFNNIDIIHYIGGGYFNTRLPWGTQLLLYELFFTTMAKLVNPNLQIIGTGLGIGPVTTYLYKSLFKVFIKKFNYLFVREKESEAFVQSLGTAKHIQCIGDDVVLLLPYFQNITQNTLQKTHFGLNFKFDNVHQYGELQTFFRKLVHEQYQSGEKVVFFDFGKDHLALKQFPIEFVQQLSVCSCYETGLQHFAQRLAESHKSVGFAYHFAILCALMNIPNANIYFDDYYRQKTGGVIELLCNQHLTLSYQQLKNLAPKQLLQALESVDQQNVSQIFNHLKRDYKDAYQTLEIERSQVAKPKR